MEGHSSTRRHERLRIWWRCVSAGRQTLAHSLSRGIILMWLLRTSSSSCPLLENSKKLCLRFGWINRHYHAKVMWPLEFVFSQLDIFLLSSCVVRQRVKTHLATGGGLPRVPRQAIGKRAREGGSLWQYFDMLRTNRRRDTGENGVARQERCCLIWHAEPEICHAETWGKRCFYLWCRLSTSTSLPFLECLVVVEVVAAAAAGIISWYVRYFFLLGA